MKVNGPWREAAETQAVCSILTNAGYQALFVGGCVRNALLGAPVMDIDISTDALPETVINLAADAGFKQVPTGIEHGTVTILSGGIPHEVTTFRKDVETFGRRAVVAFSSDVADDALRRDFTMNALYARPDGTVIDPLGGLPDLFARRFRFIEDPDKRIQEDYLRILRFFRFNAWYGDPQEGLDPEAIAAIAGNIEGLQHLSRERVGSEILKLLEAEDPVFATAAMRQCGVLAAVLPGADDSGLGPLVHLEEQHSVAPEPIRRLASMGGEEVSERLRLSKAQARKLDVLRNGIESPVPAAELGYLHGEDLAMDILLLRAVLLQNPFTNSDQRAMKLGASAKLPVSAADFQPEFSGRALGEQLKKAERRWIASGFSLGRDELINDREGE